jgi:hypothetical protein
VYGEDGALELRGEFVLAGTGRGATAAELKYDAFDGEKILLSGGLVLEQRAPK